MRRRPLHDHVESGTRISRTLSDDHAHRGKSDDRSVALLPSSSAPSARRNAALELVDAAEQVQWPRAGFALTMMGR
jgi:hypothetical protein